MEVKNKTIGFAVTGSFCTFSSVLPQVKKLCEAGADVIPIFSFITASCDTRFFKAIDFRKEIEDITGNAVIDTIQGAEPIGPKKLLDLLIVAPCTGNTLAKLNLGITDTPVTMAVKAHSRNQRPVLIAVSTNDALGANAKNLGELMARKHVYFVPMRQDACVAKSNSIVADMTKIPMCAEYALDSKQMQPVLIAPL